MAMLAARCTFRTAIHVQEQHRIRHAFAVLQLQNAVRAVRAGQQARTPSACCLTDGRTASALTPSQRKYVWGEQVGGFEGHQGAALHSTPSHSNGNLPDKHIRPHTARPFRIRTQMQHEAEHGFNKVLHWSNQLCLCTFYMFGSAYPSVASFKRIDSKQEGTFQPFSHEQGLSTVMQASRWRTQSARPARAKEIAGQEEMHEIDRFQQMLDMQQVNRGRGAVYC